MEMACKGREDYVRTYITVDTIVPGPKSVYSCERHKFSPFCRPLQRINKLILNYMFYFQDFTRYTTK